MSSRASSNYNLIGWDNPHPNGVGGLRENKKGDNSHMLNSWEVASSGCGVLPAPDFRHAQACNAKTGVSADKWAADCTPKSGGGAVWSESTDDGMSRDLPARRVPWGLSQSAYDVPIGITLVYPALFPFFAFYHGTKKENSPPPGQCSSPPERPGVLGRSEHCQCACAMPLPTTHARCMGLCTQSRMSVLGRLRDSLCLQQQKPRSHKADTLAKYLRMSCRSC